MRLVKTKKEKIEETFDHLYLITFQMTWILILRKKKH